MNSRSLGATAVYAWPDAEVAVMGAESAVRVLHRRQLAVAADEDRDRILAQLVDEHKQAAGSVDRGVALGLVDEVIDPSDTRSRLAAAFAAASPGALKRRGRHGNIPL
jgi:acetyl-CoA/propionyl-CoA carboxylase carboxyl transferase subunit